MLKFLWHGLIDSLIDFGFFTFFEFKKQICENWTRTSQSVGTVWQTSWTSRNAVASKTKTLCLGYANVQGILKTSPLLSICEATTVVYARSFLLEINKMPSSKISDMPLNPASLQLDPTRLWLRLLSGGRLPDPIPVIPVWIWDRFHIQDWDI